MPSPARIRSTIAYRVLGTMGLLAAGFFLGCTREDAGRSTEHVDTAAQAVLGTTIRVNQVGYVPNAPKIASAVRTAATTFVIKNASGTQVWPASGTANTSAPIVDTASGDTVVQADFSAYAGPCTGCTVSIGTEDSQPFDISTSVITDLRKTALKYFYFNRTMQLESQYLTDFASAGHARIALRPNDSAVTSYLGWTNRTFNVKDFHMDAGDVGTYGENHAMGMWLLMNLAETFSSTRTGTDGYALNIPESGNGIPDLIDEIAYSGTAAMSMLGCTPGTGESVTCVSGELGAHKIGHYIWYPYVKDSAADWGVFTPWREAYCDYSDLTKIPAKGWYADYGQMNTTTCASDADCVAAGAEDSSGHAAKCLLNRGTGYINECRNNCEARWLRQVSKPSTGATYGYTRYLAQLARLYYDAANPTSARSIKAKQFWNAAKDAYGRARSLPFRMWYNNMSEPKTNPEAQDASTYAASNLTPWAKTGCADANCAQVANACVTDADCALESACTTDDDCDQGSKCLSSKCKSDWNGDGTVNASDVAPVAKCFASSPFETNSNVSNKACVVDYDGNGSVEVSAGVPDPADFTSPRGTGPYDDRTPGDDAYAASSEMYLTAYALADAGVSTYKTHVTSSPFYKRVERGDWSSDALFGTLSLLTATSDLTTTDKDAMKANLYAYANYLRDAVNNQGYPSATPNVVNTSFGWKDQEGPDGKGDNRPEYRWGSNKDDAYGGMILVHAYKLSGDMSYLRAAYRTLDYLLGDNPMNASYVTGWGENAYSYAHHRFGLYSSGIKATPFPKGWLLGGPMSTLKICGWDETKTRAVAGADAKSDRMPANTSDSAENAWCTMEVTLDWNGGLAWLAYALEDLKTVVTPSGTGSPTCTDGVQNGTETGVDCGGSCSACVTPTCSDGVKNGTETGVDCGGSCAACATGQANGTTCTAGTQCTSGNCVDGVCCNTACGAGASDCQACNLTGTVGTCSFVASTVVCRASTGTCDVAENCTGSSATCPADGFAANTVTCRASAGPCDVADKCTGSSGACPADAFAANTVQCRAASGVCDVAENCSGSSAACPADAFAANTVTCRASAGACDVADKCSGSSGSCPADALAANGTVCRASAGTCDVAETCTGSATTCPADAVASNTTVCRTSAGVCDAAELCNGTATTCPTDAFASSSTTCRSSTGACDPAEMCSGSASTCAADTNNCSTGGSGTISWDKWTNQTGTTIVTSLLTTTPNSSGTFTSFEAPIASGDNYQLRVRGYLTAPTTGSYTFWIAGDDAVELRFNSAGTAVSTTVIAYHGGWTNSQEWNKYTTQKSAAISLTAGTQYYIEAIVKEGTGGDNLAVGWAKPGEATTAPSGVIPGTQLSPYVASLLANGSACSAGSQCTSANCVDGVCCNTTCGGGVADCQACNLTGSVGTCTNAPNTTVCRAAAGTCDAAESCTGSSPTCPTDAKLASGTVCRAAVTGGCDVAEACDGTSAACPNDAVAASGTVCRSAGSSATCDPAETCSGSSNSCPSNAYASNGTACSGGSCNGSGTCVSCTPPAAPGSPVATAGNAQVTLSWATVSGATSYTIKRSTTSGSGYTTVASGVTSTSYINTGLTNGTTYYYVITATGSCESSNSTQVSATPAGATEPCTPNLTLDSTATSTGNFNTSGAYCVKVVRDMAGWGCSNFDGRTLQINDVVKTPGAMPLPAKVNNAYYFEASAGTYNYASCYWW